MQKIKEEVVGGDVVEKDEGLFGGFLIDCPKAGDTRAKKTITTYEAILEIPYTITITKEIEPALDKKGNPKTERAKPDVRAEMLLPIDMYRATGTYKLTTFDYDGLQDENSIARKFLFDLGNRLMRAEIESERKN